MNSKQAAALFSAAKVDASSKKRYLARVGNRNQIKVGDKLTFAPELNEESKTLLIDTFISPTGTANTFASLAYSIGDKFDPENQDLISLSNFTRSVFDETGMRKSAVTPFTDRGNSNADNIKALEGKSMILKNIELVNTQSGVTRIYTFE